MCVKVLGKDYHTRTVLSVLYGLAWVNIGIAVYINNRVFAFDPHILMFSAPVELRFLLWSITGTFGIVCSLGRFKSLKEWWGWTALVIMPTERAMSYLISFIFYQLGIGEGSDGLNSSVFWGCLTTCVIISSRLTDRNLR